MDDTTPQRPTSNSSYEWQVYWTAQGEPWRLYPEIFLERQRELAERRDTIKPIVEQGVYPFKDVRLSRADIEWLLHEHGPIDWSNEAERKREGLDLRGAIMSKVLGNEEENFHVLPLSRTRFGEVDATIEQQEPAAAHLEGTYFAESHLASLPPSPSASLAANQKKRKSVKVRDVRKRIEADGSYYIGSTGSHHRFKHPTKKGKVTIPGNPNDDLHPKTVGSILKQAQIP